MTEVSSKHISLLGPKGNNQDRLLTPKQTSNGSWFAVADGMGGHIGGFEAADTCISKLENIIDEGRTLKFVSIYNEIADELKSRAIVDATLSKMGSTLSVCRYKDGEVFVGHVGDTRVDHYRGGGVMARTKDQTEVQKLLDDGVISKRQAKKYPRRNVLLSVLSPDRTYELFTSQFSVQAGDRIIVSSDGFHELVPRRVLAEISSQHSLLDDFFEGLLVKLREQELKDDATCIVVEINNT